MNTKAIKKVFTVLLAIFMIATLLPAVVFADEASTGWDGETYDTSWYNTTDTEFTISTPEQLYALALIVNGQKPKDSSGNKIKKDVFSEKTINLSADINLGNKEWPSIGFKAANAFQGTFNGRGYTISGLSITESSNQVRGLFGIITGNSNSGAPAKISNLTLKGKVELSYESTSGPLRGYGGLCGSADYVEIENCYIDVTVNVTGEYAPCGGIVGSADTYLKLTNCINVGNVSGDKYVAGLVGYTDATSAKCHLIIDNCANTGNISGANYVGGLVGNFADAPTDSSNEQATLTNCYNTGNVIATGDNVGGLAATLAYKSGTVGNKVKNCFTTGTVTGGDGAEYVGAVFGNSANPGGAFAGSLISNVYYLEGASTKAIGNNTELVLTSMNADAIATADFVDTLNANAQALGATGDVFKAGTNNPVFGWQDDETPVGPQSDVMLTVTADKTSVHPGEKVTITFHLDNAVSDVAMFTFYVEYDSSVFEYIKDESEIPQPFIQNMTGYNDMVHTIAKTTPKNTYFSDTSFAGIEMMTSNYNYLWSMSAGDMYKLVLKAKDDANVTTAINLNAVINYLDRVVDSERTPATVSVNGKASGMDLTTHERLGEVDNVNVVVGHTLTKTDAVAATCQATGNIDYWTCSACNKIFSDAEGKTAITQEQTITQKIDHTPGNPSSENVVASTCTGPGSYVEVVKCSVCGTEISRETKTTEALGHDWSEWTVTKEATETEEGEKTHTCSRCNLTETETIPVLPHVHTMTKTEAVAATCTTDGNIEYYTCSGCHNYYRDENGEDQIGEADTVVAKLPHTPAEAVQENVVEATCTTAGSYDEVVYCDICETEISRTEKTVDALGHTPEEAVQENVVEATCTTAGSYDEVVYCAVCDAEISRTEKTVDALGHTPGEAVQENVVEATCTTAGSYDEVVYCEVCGDEISRTEKTVDALGHDWSEWIVDEDSTCTKKGTEYRYCFRDDCAVEETREIALKDHTWDEGELSDDEKEVTYTCTVCGTTKTEALAYVFANDEKVFQIEEGPQELVVIVKRNYNDEEADTFGHFTGVKMDDQLVDESNYTAEPGSVKITFKADYVKTLAPGEHKITVLFDNDDPAEHSLTVTKKSETPSSGSDTSGGTDKSSDSTAPKTGDSNHAATWIIIMAVAFALLVGGGIFAIRKKVK